MSMRQQRVHDVVVVVAVAALALVAVSVERELLDAAAVTQRQ
jgi:hypothetical protein